MPPAPAERQWLADLAHLHWRFSSPLSPAIPALGNRPCLNGAGVSHALIIIGWSERLLATRMGVHRTELRRILDSSGELDARSSRWLHVLSDGHLDLPRPARKDS